MKNKETLDFLKGTAMDGIIKNATAATTNNNTNPVKKIEKIKAASEAEVAPGPSVIHPVKKTAVKQTEIKADNDISTTIRIKKSLLQQARLILGKGKKTQEITEHVFLDFIKKNKKILAQNIEKEIEDLKSKI